MAARPDHVQVRTQLGIGQRHQHGQTLHAQLGKAVGGKGHAQTFLHHQQHGQGLHPPVGHFRREPGLLACAQQHVRNAGAQQRAVQQKTLFAQRPQGNLGLPAQGMLRRQGHPQGFVHHLLVLQLRRRKLAAADDQVQAALAQALEQVAGFPLVHMDRDLHRTGQQLRHHARHDEQADRRGAANVHRAPAGLALQVSPMALRRHICDLWVLSGLRLMAHALVASL